MYEFTEDCMIHIDNIDEEHRKLFQMLNEAFALVKETDNAASIAKNLIDNLKDYAITHFAHEEEYMKSIHDPELPIQQREHKAFAEKINTQELANRLHLNRSYMSELFSKDTGMSIKSYLTEKRMQRAAIMLQDPNRSVKNVAASCGFEDSLYFSRAFSKYFGISPQQYRSQILKDKKK